MLRLELRHDDPYPYFHCQKHLHFKSDSVSLPTQNQFACMLLKKKNCGHIYVLDEPQALFADYFCTYSTPLKILYVDIFVPSKMEHH